MKSMEELRSALLITIDKYKDDVKVLKHMQEIYAEKNLPLMTVGVLFKNEKVIEDINDMELGVWCYYLHEITQDKTIVPNDYLTENEIYNIQTYVNNNKLNLQTDKIVLHNVEREYIKGKVFYSCHINFYDIYKYQQNSLIVYNFETQRQANFVKYKDKICKRANINLASVEKMRILAKNDKLPPSLITWNIRQTPNWREGVIYDEESKTLIITPDFEKKIFVDCIDGQHRDVSITKAVDDIINEGLDKKLDGYMYLSITTYTTGESQDYIDMMNQQSIINPEHTEAFAKNDVNDFVKLLNYESSSNTNIMYDKIATTIKEVNIDNSKYTTVGILSNGFRLSNLKFDKPRKLEKHLNYFVDIFNNILGYFDEKYDEDEKKMRKETIALEPNIFVGYIAMGIAMLEEENPIDKLNEILESGVINLNRKDYDWGSIDIFRKNPKSYKKIYDYFYELVKANLK